MLNPADVAPVMNALEDESARVRVAARRVMQFIEPLLSERVAETDSTGADAAARYAQWQGPSTWDTPEHWRRYLREDTDPYSRLTAAVKLAFVGEPAGEMERIVDDVERAPMDLEGLGRFRW